MKKVFAILVVALVALFGTACSSDTPARAEPFVGQWESTGGEQIAMRVDAPVDGAYPVRITGDGVDLTLSAKAAGENLYEATPDTGTVWTFRMVDEELLTATAAPEGQASVSTSFKRIGE
jgi:hypothetical protein